MIRPRTTTHIISRYMLQPPDRGPFTAGWQCTCGDHENYQQTQVELRTATLGKALDTAAIHTQIWKGRIL